MSSNNNCVALFSYASNLLIVLPPNKYQYANHLMDSSNGNVFDWCGTLAQFKSQFSMEGLTVEVVTREEIGNILFMNGRQFADKKEIDMDGINRSVQRLNTFMWELKNGKSKGNGNNSNPSNKG